MIGARPEGGASGVWRAGPGRRPALEEGRGRGSNRRRPAPPAQNPLPFQLAAGIGLLLSAARGLKRAQGGQKFAWWYMAPSALATIVLVFVPFSVGGGMSLFHYGDGKWIFIGFRNFIHILGEGFAP